MSIINATLEEDTDQPQGCDNDWCNGPTSETLPCFECYDRTREYLLSVIERPDGAQEDDR